MEGREGRRRGELPKQRAGGESGGGGSGYKVKSVVPTPTRAKQRNDVAHPASGPQPISDGSLQLEAEV